MSPEPLAALLIPAVIQGVAEFLPVSSSAHLVLVKTATGWSADALYADLAIHVGILLAVLLYFRADWGRVLGGIGRIALGRFDMGGRLAVKLVLATVPMLVSGGIAGYMIYRLGGDLLGMLEVIAWSTLVCGILLGLVDRWSMSLRRVDHLTYGGALAIGLAQVVSMIPGVSRVGITITMARLLGLERREAARFSLLLSVPTIVLAGLLIGQPVQEQAAALAAPAAIGLHTLVCGGVAFLAGYATIGLLMRWLERRSFLPFVVYRVGLGLVLLAYLHWPG